MAACNTGIPMLAWKPAELPIEQGTVVYVRCHGPGFVARPMEDALEYCIATDGFYSLPGQDSSAHKSIRLHVGEVELQPRKKTKEHSSRKLEVSASVVSGGQNIFRRRYYAYADSDMYGHADIPEACRDIAEEIMKDLTPHRYTYYVSVKTSEENPTLEQAASACSAGDWSSGKSLVKRAIEQNPDEAEAYYLLGLIERHNRRYSASDANFRKAFSLSAERRYSEAISRNAELQRAESQAKTQLNAR